MKHTVGLAVEGISGTSGSYDVEMIRILRDTSMLDKRITQIQTGWLQFQLTQLTTIVSSRAPDRSPITRISANVESFALPQLRQFMTKSGKDLYQLHLNTTPDPSQITPLDLHRLAPVIRKQCPKLVDLLISIDFAKDGNKVLDHQLSLPPSELIYGTGSIRKLTILAYGLGWDIQALDNMLSLNFARNLASILAPGFEIIWREGSKVALPDIMTRGMGSPLFGARQLEKVSKGIRFFQRSVSLHCSIGRTLNHLMNIADILQTRPATTTILHQSFPRSSRCLVSE